MTTARHVLLCWVVLLVTLGSVVPQAVRAETPAEHQQRMAWWREARFGMFIHWGIMSIPGKDFGAMLWDKIPVAEYEKLVPQYNPVNWNPQEVVALARRAGQKYLVLVAKHHDGFAMWDSKLSDYTILHTPYQRDIVGELAAECARQGVVFGVYYSILDWHHPDANQAGWPRYVEYMKGQLRELLTQYGPIGVVWFDGDWIPEWTDEQGRDLAQFVWSLQPQTIINNRIGKGRQDNSARVKAGHFSADFVTPEQEVPPTGLPGIDWESCMTINNSWSWKKTDVAHKSAAECLRLLIDTASKGGNLLLNIGPKPDGTIVAEQQDRLQAIAAWMQTNAESIHGTTASPFETQLTWGRCTQRALDTGTRLYLHVFDWPTDGRLSVAGPWTQVTRAYLLADPQRTPLTTEVTAGQVNVTLPSAAPDPIASVVVLEVR